MCIDLEAISVYSVVQIEHLSLCSHLAANGFNGSGEFSMEQSRFKIGATMLIHNQTYFISIMKIKIKI